MLGFVDLIKDVYNNSKAHGWHDCERSVSTEFALITSEWAEALEEDRAGRPLFYRVCALDGSTCEVNPDGSYAKECCDSKFIKPKPEGSGIELLDGIIRIFDLIGAHEGFEEFFVCGPNELINFEWIDHKLSEDANLQIDGFREFGQLVQFLNDLTSTAHCEYMEHENLTDDMIVSFVCIVAAVFAWIRKQGYCPKKLLLEKHEYNKTRPYMHGGKKY